MKGAADHLLPLADGWSLWRPIFVRGAGFPAREVLRLATPNTAAALDRLLELELEAERTRRAAMASLREDRVMPLGEKKRLLKSISQGRFERSDEAGPIVAEARVAADRASTARREASELLDEEQAAVSERLRSLVGQDRFREAVTWQNRNAVRTALDLLLQVPPPRRRRQHELLLASYLQRYCVKVDTIGFFGPSSWGSLRDGGDGMTLRPGPSLLAARKVYFESWAIDALALRLAEAEGIRPWLAPRRRTTVRLDGERCRFEDGRTVALSPEAARLLAWCDGEQSAKAIAKRLGDEAEGLRRLEELNAQGVILWTLEVPVGSPFPERALRGLLVAIGDPAIRDPALGALGELERGRDAVAEAAGDPARLASALDELDRTFERLTETSATRNAGRTYAGRTLLYEDCRRALALELGPAVIDRLRAPLALVLSSARWYTHTVAARFRVAFRDAYQTLRAASGAEPVEYLPFLRAVEPLFSGGASRLGGSAPITEECLRELQARWAEILALPSEGRQARLRAADLSSRVATAFAAPDSGAAMIRFFCPDLMIAAESSEAIDRGDFRIVLSELHLGVHTYVDPCFLESCDEPEVMTRARTSDLSCVEIFPILEKERHIRGYPSTYGDEDLHFETTDTRSWLPRSRVLAAADLTVALDGDRLVVRAPDGRSFDVVDFHAFFLNRAVVNQFQLLAPARHTPRVVIDDLVVARESWRFERDEIPLLDEKLGSFERFAAARRWAREQGLPRFLFVKIPEEKKPFFLDLESSTYVDLFAHTARKASKVTLSEMLADFSHAWLRDGDGDRYLCELRLAALDAATAESTATTRSSHT